MSNRLSNSGAIRVAWSTAIAFALLLLATPLVAQSRSDTSMAADTLALGARGVLLSRVTVPAIVDRSPLLSSSMFSRTNATSVTSVPVRRAAGVRVLSSGSTWENTTVMVVGGAAMLAGVFVGGKAGTAVTVGGTVVGLVGFLSYLK